MASETTGQVDYHTFMSIPGDLNAFMVPQQAYSAPGIAFTPGPSITYCREKSPGIFLGAAIQKTFRVGTFEETGMTDGTEASDLRSPGEKFSLRINWPGCQRFFETINVEEKYHGETRKISKAKLAHKVAKAVAKFLNEPQRGDSWNEECSWNPKKIEFDRVILYELRHVSIGSYQPVLLLHCDGESVETSESSQAAPESQPMELEDCVLADADIVSE